jgi:hypothetical protein
MGYLAMTVLYHKLLNNNIEFETNKPLRYENRRAHKYSQAPVFSSRENSWRFQFAKNTDLV